CRYSVPSPFSSTHTPPPEPSTLSLHDALPISCGRVRAHPRRGEVEQSRKGRHLRAGRHGIAKANIDLERNPRPAEHRGQAYANRSEEHTSELQSRGHLVCRLLLEKKKKKK